MRLSLRRGFGVVTGAWSAPRRRPATALLVARLISALTTLLVLAYVSRVRGIEALGIASLGVVAGTLLAALAEGGTNSLATREISRSPTDGATLLSAIVVLRAVMFLLVVVVSIPLFRVLFGATGDVILMFAMAFVVQQLAELPRAILLATDRPYLLSTHYSVENLAWASAVIIVLAMGADLILAALAGTVVMTISVVIGAGLALVYGVRPGRITRAAFRKAIVLGLPFAAGSLVTVAALRLDTILVGLLVPSGIAVAGAYFAATRLIASAEYIPEAIGRAAYPDLARRLSNADGDAADIMHPAARDLLLISLPLPMALLIGGAAVLPVVFGSELAPYVWILTALGLMIPARFLVILFGVSLTSANAQGRRATITGIAVLVGLGLNLVLLPAIGVPAAVLVSILTTCLLFVPYSREVRRRFGIPIQRRDVLLPLACSFLAAVPALACRAVLEDLDAPLQLVATVVVYGLGYVAAILLVQAGRRGARSNPGETHQGAA